MVGLQASFANSPSRAASVDLAVGVIIGGAFRKDRRFPGEGRHHARRRRVFGGLDFSNWFILLGTRRRVTTVR